jgi:hypothetical protein
VKDITWYNGKSKDEINIVEALELLATSLQSVADKIKGGELDINNDKQMLEVEKSFINLDYILKGKMS